MNKVGGIYVIVDNSGSITKLDSGYMAWETEKSARKALNGDITRNIIGWYYAEEDYVPQEGMLYHRKDGTIVGTINGGLIQFDKRSEILPYLLDNYYKIVYIERLHV